MKLKALILALSLSLSGAGLFAQAPRPPEPKPAEKATLPDIATQGQREGHCQKLGDALVLALGQDKTLAQRSGYTLEEYNAYVAASKETNQQIRLQRLYEFVEDFPNSSLLPDVRRLYETACRGSGTSVTPVSPPLQPESQVLTIPATSDAPCIAFASDSKAQVALAQKIGGGQTVTSHVSLKDITFTACIILKLQQNRFAMPSFRWHVIHTSEINASADPIQRVITVNDSLIHFMNYNEDEVAAVVAHEIGHLQDFQTPVGSGEVSCIPGTRMAVREIQKCEAKADYLGLQYLLGAGYNGFGMAGQFGRFLVYQGDTGMRGFLMRFTSDHPINIDRLKAVRAEWIKLCEEHSPACQNAVQ